MRDHRVATRGRGRSARLASLAPRAFSSGLGLLAPLYTVHQPDPVVYCLEMSWNRCLSPPIPAGHFPSCPRTGEHPSGSPSLCAHPTERPDTAPRAGGSAGGAPHTAFHDVPPATIIRLAIQEASPTARTPRKAGGNRAIQAIVRRLSLPRPSRNCAPSGVRVATRRLP